MRTLALILCMVSLPALAVEKTIPAKTYDEVAGLPVVEKRMRRDEAAPTNWNFDMCFIARTTTNTFIPLPAPCASCYGPDNAATVELCRARVRANSENGL